MAIKRYRWSSVLDDKICNKCASLNGRVLTQDEVDAGLCPPIHGHELNETPCRCILIPIDTEYRENEEF